jgi:hypothetical protein
MVMIEMSDPDNLTHLKEETKDTAPNETIAPVLLVKSVCSFMKKFLTVAIRKTVTKTLVLFFICSAEETENGILPPKEISNKGRKEAAGTKDILKQNQANYCK